MSEAAPARGGDAYLFPLSFAQTRLWLIDQLAPGNTLYNLRIAVRLRQPVDPRPLRRAIEAVVARHEVLRTVFRVVDGEPAQLVLPSMPVPLECYDLRGLPPERRQTEAVRLATTLGDERFDLAEGPLLRAMLIWVGTDDFVLVLIVHHIVADGWSMGVLARELGALYDSFLAGREAPLPPLPIQYPDFAVWQREQLAGERLAEPLAYWRSALAELPELALPLDFPRPAVQAHRGAAVPFELPAVLVERLTRLGREAGATPFMVLLAGFGVVLGRWSGQDEVVVGAPVAGRERAELEGLIGFFVNTLVLRLDLRGDPTFRELVERAREVALGAYAHAELPFERLVEELASGRDLSRNPLFQVTLQLFESPTAPDLVQAHSGFDLPVTSSLFDLRVDLWPSPNGLAGRAEFDTDLFERSSVQWLLDRYRFVLEQAAEEPERPLSRLSLLPPAHARLLEAWNDTVAPVAHGTVVERVHQRARTSPERLAVADGEEAWSYAELHARANRFAHELLARGAGPGELVALCLPRGCAFAACALGVMTAGAAYVPLDAASPPGRIRSVLDEARPRVVIADPSLARVLGPVEGAELVSIPPWPGASEEAPEVDVDPRSAAYVIYTSGSTGAPKGVVVEHRSLLNLVSWHLRAYELGEDDRCSQIASAGFDAAVWELWPALAAGASVHVCDDETRSDVDLLPGWLEANGITVAFVPTPLAEVLLGRPWPAGSPLRVMLTGGDRLRLFADPSHPYRLVNHYGPTEGTVVSTAGRVEAEPFHGRLPRIGAPIRNTVCYVVGPDGELLGPGCSGELWIGGIGVARGYHGDPGLGGRFLPNPFADSPDRVYRTGDLVRWEEDGSLSFLDRVDNQLKIRGHRIEPREVEAVLLEHTRVAQAFVTGRAEGEDDSTVLVAYAVPSEGEALDGRALRRWLRGRLPEPMIPSWVVVLRELPITANGKIDRDALPPPSGAEPESPVAVGPANPTEEALCRLWADALGVERVGVDEDFFDLGGHSLLATQLVSRIREAFRFELPLRTLFEQPTVAQIAAVLRSEAGPPERADRAGEVLLHVLALPEEAVEAMLAAQSGIET